MSAIASMKLSTILDNTLGIMYGTTNDAAVSVNATFDPEGFDPKGIARWVNRAGGIPVGYPNLTLSVRRPTAGSRMYKVMVKLAVPTLEVTAPTTVTGIQPAPTKAYDCACVMEFMLPERSTLAERTALFNLVHSLFLGRIKASDLSPSDDTGAPLLAAVLNFDPPY